TRHALGWRATLAALRQNGPHFWKLLTTRFAVTRAFGAHTFPTTRPRFQSRGDMTLLLTIPEMQRPDAWRDDTMIYVGPSIEEKVRHVDFPFDRLDDRPLVYISLGTLATGDIGFFRTCLTAFGTLPAQFVMSIGQKHAIADLRPIPGNFIVRSYVPQLEILSRAAAFVTHCGFTGFQEALWYGVPMVGIPQQIEQLMNTRLSARRGATIPLENHFNGQPVSAGELRAAVEKILADPSYREAARGFQTAMRKSGGFRQAASELEKFAAQKSAPPSA
ncbi:MAG: nucleotide disphospho-sugar-binding domain-containing protein, partial [Cucumibacter sp.]